MGRHSFPEGFLWGVATSSQQIEGGRHDGGRGESVWDRFATLPGAIEDGSNADVACEHYHRWREDVGLMSWLGVGAYRFSVAWPRVMPNGDGPPNTEGLDFYDALVDGLLSEGIEPFVTLNHWDLPQALQDRGGWPARETVKAFVEYAGAVTSRLGDRVRHWTTHNEPWCVATHGYEQGCHAPGRRSAEEGLAAAHHLLLSHGLAVDRMRQDLPEARLGVVLNLSPARPATETEADRDAARHFDGMFNRWYLEPLFNGRYPEDAVEDRVRRGHLAGRELPFVEDGDLRAIAAPLDFLGVNYYSRTVLRAGADGNPVAVPMAPAEELTEMGWEVYPEGLTDILLRVRDEYDPAEIYITENGAAFPEDPDASGVVDDSRRVSFLREHFLAALRAISAGVPLKGYFVWSLLDNFEWGHGYTKRFGLFSVNYETLKRTAKESANWYRETIAANAVTDDE